MPSKQAQREWYKRNKDKVYSASRASRLANKAWLDEQKMKPCADCGGTFPPVCMDFHHRDPSTKTMNVAMAIFMVGRQRVIDEIAKCDLICANCHRIREHVQSVAQPG